MVDIGVYTSLETLEEKIAVAEDTDFSVWWNLSKKPESEPEKIFFAVDKKWQGYFTVKYTRDLIDEKDIYLGEWHELEEKPERLPFQGFTYDVPGVHVVCFRCKKDCNQPASFWSGMMPDEIFCDDFELDEEMLQKQKVKREKTEAEVAR